MGQKIATLEIGLEMATGTAVADLNRFGGTVDKVSAQAIRDLDRIDVALQSVGNLDAATASAVKLAEATAKSAIEMARDADRAERSGERVAAQLERQNAAYGLSRAELRSLRAEEAARYAEQNNLHELAARIRAQDLELSAKELASARALRFEQEAMAQDADEARQRAVVEAVEERARAEAQVIAQLRERERLEAALARTMGTNRPRAIDSGATYSALAEQAEQMERMAVAAERLRQEIDPAYAAQQRFNQEMARAQKLVGAGSISLDEYCGKLRIERELLSQSTEGHQRLAVAQRFTAAEVLNLSRQFQDIGVTAAMGMNPLMILVQQGPQIWDVLEQAKQRGVSAGAALGQMGKDLSSYAVTGFGKLAEIATPTNLALGATAGVAIAAVRALGTYQQAVGRFEVTVAGLGRTSEQSAAQLEAIAEAAAASGKRTLSATRESVAAFAAAGIEGSQTLTMLAADVDKYAKLTGQDAAAAQTALAEAMKDPARAADTLTQQLGLLTGAQYEHIRQLAAQGDQEQAVAELTRILTRDLAANSHEVTGLAHYMDLLGSSVSGVTAWFGRLDQRIRGAGAAYDAWLKQNVGGWAVNLLGTGNQTPIGANPNAGRNQDQIAALNASQSLNTSGVKQFNDLLAQQRVLQRGLADTTGLTATQVQALRHDYSAVTDTIKANQTATGSWITTQERQHLVAQAQAKLAAAHTQSEKAAAQQTITRLQLGTQVLTQQERQTQAMDAYNRVADRYVKPKGAGHADELAREAKATETQIANLYKLADAYGVSGDAALVAEARTKAESAAIKSRADIDAAVDRQIRLTIAQRVADGERGVASIRDQARIQTEVSAAVAAGNVPAEKASQLLQQRIAELPLLNAIEAAYAREKGARDKGQIKVAGDMAAAAKAAEKALADQRAAQADKKAADTGTYFTGASSDAERRIDELKEQLRLVGMTEDQQVRAMAAFKATQKLKSDGQATDTAYAKQYIADQVEIAARTAEVAGAQREWNDALTFTADQWELIARNVTNAARGMADAFGDVGRAIGDMASIYAGYRAQQEREDERHSRAMELARGDAAKERENRRYALATATTQIGLYGDMATAARGFFKEGSDGYKGLTTAIQVFRAIEFALSVRAMAQDAVETASRLAKSAARAIAHGVEAVARAIASLPFPANIAAGAATIAALAAIGVSVAGGIGGGGRSQLGETNEGRGTVLGDTKAQSESIRRGIDALKEVDVLMLTSSREMLNHLRSIDSQIGGVAAQIVRGGEVDATAGITEGFQKNLIGKVLGSIPLIGGLLGSLFGSKTEIVASGLYGRAQTVGDIVANGYDAGTFADTKKTSKFLGITTGTKYATQYGAADAGLENQFTLILRGFAAAIGDAAGPLGEATDAVKARLNGFVVDIGKVDLKGLTGEQITERLSAIFGAAADGMAEAAFPGISRFQKAGEGMFETLVRISSTVEAVTSSFEMLGRSGIGVDASIALADLFENVSDLTSAQTAYFDAYYTAAEQAAAKTAQMERVMGSLGLAMPKTLAGFRSLVEAQDLTTAAGRSVYATLIQLAPAFADLQSAMGGAKSAADIMAERQDLERKLLELNGDTAAIRALDLAKLDASNRGLQEQVWAAEAAKDAADKAEELRKAWSSVGDSIADEIKRIRGLDNAQRPAGFAGLMGQFNAASVAARGGDMDAAKQLPTLSRDLLDAAAAVATSRQELERVRAQTAASLEETYASIQSGGAGDGMTSTAERTAASMAQAATAATTTASTSSDMLGELRKLREDMQTMRSENTAGLVSIAGAVNRSAKVLENVTQQNGGDAISTVAAA